MSQPQTLTLKFLLDRLMSNQVEVVNSKCKQDICVLDTHVLVDLLCEMQLALNILMHYQCLKVGL